MSYLGVDTLMLQRPPLVKDKYFDDEDLVLPYTEAAAMHKKRTFRGSVHYMQWVEYINQRVHNCKLLQNEGKFDRFWFKIGCRICWFLQSRLFCFWRSHSIKFYRAKKCILYRCNIVFIPENHCPLHVSFKKIAKNLLIFFFWFFPYQAWARKKLKQKYFSISGNYLL